MNAAVHPAPSAAAAAERLPRAPEPQGWEIEYPRRRPVAAAVETCGDVDAGTLWTGGAATAVVASLIGLVGVLATRVLAQAVPHVDDTVAATASSTAMLCLAAAAAALAATGLAHLLLISTPRPLDYLGWIVGLTTVAVAVLPLVSGVPLAAALAEALIVVVIGIAVGSLVTGAAVAARR